MEDILFIECYEYGEEDDGEISWTKRYLSAKTIIWIVKSDNDNFRFKVHGIWADWYYTNSLQTYGLNEVRF